MASTGACVVCGQQCVTRCSNCSEKGIDWMFFCSKEHQKLIWWTHKRVCGKAKWEWPHFSEKEQNLVRFSIQKEFTSPWGQRGNLLDIIQPIAGDKNAFELLIGITTGEAPGSHGLTDAQRAEHLCRMRAGAFDARCHHRDMEPVKTQTELLQRVSEDPLGFMTMFEDKFWQQVLSPTWDSSTSLSTLQHRLVIFFTLLCVHYKDLDLIDQHDPWIKHAREQLNGVVESWSGPGRNIAGFLVQAVNEEIKVQIEGGVSPWQCSWLFEGKKDLPP